MDASRVLAECRGESLTWADLGATGRLDWVAECRADWDAQRTDLDAREIELALDICEDGAAALDRLACEDIVALYAP